MTWLVAFLTGPGGLYAVLVAAIGAALVYLRRDARQDERNKQAADRLKSIKHKKEIDDEVAGLDPGALDQRFRRWLRKRG